VKGQISKGTWGKGIERLRRWDAGRVRKSAIGSKISLNKKSKV